MCSIFVVPCVQTDLVNSYKLPDQALVGSVTELITQGSLRQACPARLVKVSEQVGQVLPLSLWQLRYP